ncbi:MAG: efflux transporter outer membrane subunit [Gemmataceae bacterium]
MVIGASISGCTTVRQFVKSGFKVGPNFAPPPAPVADTWTHADDARVQCVSANPCQWWSVFDDPVLDGLICTAHAQNLNLKKAAFRIQEARIGRNKEAGNLLPQIQANVTAYNHGMISDNLTQGAFPRNFDNWFHGFIASWELDIWGKIRRKIESARADLASSEEDYRDVLVILLSDVATNYVRLRANQQRLAYALRNVELQKGTLKIARQRFEAGKAPEMDYQQARINLNQTESTIPSLVTGIWEANNRLCVLLGEPIHELNLGDECAPIPSAPNEVVVGIPADLLRRRPDVRKAERDAASQCAQIGVTEADFLPAISIAGFLGYASNEFAQLFQSSSLTGFISPSYTWRMLNYGRLLANYRIEKTKFEQRILEYQQQVLRAGEEVENAMVAYLQAQAQARSLQESVDAATRFTDLVFSQYQEGAIDFDRVFNAQKTLVQQQDRLASAQQDVALNLIKVYRALGGGWEVFECADHDSGSSPVCEQPVDEQPVVDVPVDEQPVDDLPADDPSADDIPVNEQPADDDVSVKPRGERPADATYEESPSDTIQFPEPTDD